MPSENKKFSILLGLLQKANSFVDTALNIDGFVAAKRVAFTVACGLFMYQTLKLVTDISTVQSKPVTHFVYTASYVSE